MEAQDTFLSHLSDNFRRSIAVNFVKHEFRKLLPQLREASFWGSIDEQIDGWYGALSVRNFWNGIHGISMGFRLKSLVPWITSINMQWDEKDLPVEELWFGGKFNQAVSQAESESARAVKEWIYRPENQDILKQVKTEQEQRALETAPRDDSPIFVVRKEKRLRVIDGNRRVLRAIINDKDSIRAAIGEPIAQPALFEHWVPTQLLVDLVFWHKRQRELGRETTKAVAEVIAELIRDSSAGRKEFVERSIHRDEKSHLELAKAVEKVLQVYGISFKI